HAAADRVLCATADDQLLALGLPPETFHERLYRCVLLAAALHDLGKANDHFQGMVTGKRNVQQNPQGLRHEWVTILMMSALKQWLLPAVANSDTDYAIVEWAISGHHPAFNHESPPDGPPKQGGSGTTMSFLLGHPDAAVALDW